MGVVGCECEVPQEGPDPRKAGICLKCAKRIDPNTVNSDVTMKAFFDRLALGLPEGESHSFRSFRLLCEERERKGRPRFQFQALGKDNANEAIEEAADLANYMAFHRLQRIRQGKSPESGFIMVVAELAFRAYEGVLRLRQGERGSP